MDNTGVIAAIAWAGHERGLSYGQMAASMKPGELEKICVDYRTYLREQRTKRMKDAAEKRSLRREEKLEEKRRKALRIKAVPAKVEKERAGRALSFNPDAAMSLYNERYNDAQIAAELGTHDYNIRRWRHTRGLPPVTQKAAQPPP